MPCLQQHSKKPIIACCPNAIVAGWTAVLHNVTQKPSQRAQVTDGWRCSWRRSVIRSMTRRRYRYVISLHPRRACCTSQNPPSPPPRRLSRLNANCTTSHGLFIPDSNINTATITVPKRDLSLRSASSASTVQHDLTIHQTVPEPSRAAQGRECMLHLLAICRGSII